jgi:copper chaperone NosL
MRHGTKLLAAALLFGLAACGEEQKAEAPPPQEVTEDAVGQFCGMDLVEHPGPKGQIFVRGEPEPLWFATVRELFAFTMLPEMPKDVAAIYVNDMARATSWDQPEPGTWMEAEKGFYVIGSRQRSGMNTDELVPFGDEAAARAFAAEQGGTIVRFDEMPEDAVFPGTEGTS